MADQDIEFLQWRVEATAATSEYEQYAERGSIQEREQGAEDISERDARSAYFGETSTTCPAYRSADLPPGAVVEGPAFVDAETTTIVLPPGSRLELTASNNYYIEP